MGKDSLFDLPVVLVKGIQGVKGTLVCFLGVVVRVWKSVSKLVVRVWKAVSRLVVLVWKAVSRLVVRN